MVKKDMANKLSMTKDVEKTLEQMQLLFEQQDKYYRGTFLDMSKIILWHLCIPRLMPYLWTLQTFLRAWHTFQNYFLNWLLVPSFKCDEYQETKRNPKHSLEAWKEEKKVKILVDKVGLSKRDLCVEAFASMVELMLSTTAPFCLSNRPSYKPRLLLKHIKNTLCKHLGPILVYSKL